MVAAAVAHYGPVALAGNARFPTGTSPRDLVAAADQVESTYLIRMWAEFETGLRSYRRHITGNQDDQIRTRNLIEWTAGVKQGRAISKTFGTRSKKSLNIGTSWCTTATTWRRPLR